MDAHPTEPTGPTYPSLVTKMLSEIPALIPTTDDDTLIGRMLTYGDPLCHLRSN